MKKNRKKMQNARQFKPENIMKCGKTNRGFALVLIAVLTIATMCMGGCNSGTNDDEVTVSSETEEADVTNVAEEPEFENVEDPVGVEEPEVEVTEEPEESLDYIVREDGRIQPAIHYASALEFNEFVDLLELEEAVLILWSEERNVIIYNGDSFEKEEGDAVSLYPPKEVADYTTIGVSMSENPLIENMYAILYNDEYGTPDFTIQLEYSDGSAEELTFHITLQ